jgi:hypothetical protein
LGRKKKQSVIGKGKEKEDTYPSESASEWMNKRWGFDHSKKEPILWVVTGKNDDVFLKHERLKRPTLSCHKALKVKDRNVNYNNFCFF